MHPHSDSPERRPRVRKRTMSGGHAPDPDGEPLCQAQPQVLRFSDPPTCSQCVSVLAAQAGVAKKKKNRVKGKHAKGPGGTPLCGVDAKKAFFSKAPTCAGCQEALAAAATPPPAPAARKGRAAKTATWVIAACPVCDAPIPEHRMKRHMNKVHPQSN